MKKYILLMLMLFIAMTHSAPLESAAVSTTFKVPGCNVKKEKKFITHCDITVYNPERSQCDSDPTVTASGYKINMRALKHGRVKIVAISRDLLWCIPLKSVIEIEGYGRYTVEDKLNPRFDHRIDIVQHHSKGNFKDEKVKITLIKKGKPS